MVCYFPEWSLEVGGWTIRDRSCVYMSLVIGIWPGCVVAALGLIFKPRMCARLKLCVVVMRGLNHSQTWSIFLRLVWWSVCAKIGLYYVLPLCNTWQNSSSDVFPLLWIEGHCIQEFNINY